MAGGELSERDVASLLKLRVMLCVPQQTVEAAHVDICGKLFEKVLGFFLPLYLIGYTYQKSITHLLCFLLFETPISCIILD